MCSDLQHRADIDEAYDIMYQSIRYPSQKYLPCFFGKHKYNIEPGWNDNCKQVYYIARDNFIDWNNSGRLRNGLIFDTMKKSRSDLKCIEILQKKGASN